MPIRVTDYLKVDKRAFDGTGALDTILDVDTKLYISPLLLRSSDIPEIDKSYENVQTYFKKTLILLRASKQQGDRAWREATKRLRFREPTWLPLGYSGQGTSGRGIGNYIQKQLTNTAKEIVDLGVAEPEIFELIGLLEENVGPDLISDMIGNIILPDLLNYTVRVLAELNVATAKLNTYNHLGREVFLPTFRNNKRKYPVVLIPRNILKPLPIMTTWDDVDSVAAQNHEVRRQMNNIIGTAWSDIATTKKKGALRDILFSEPRLFDELISDYRNAPPETYDFLSDPAGFVKWVESARIFANQYPLELEPSSVRTSEEVLEIVLKICNKFKKLVEDNGLSKELYNEGTLKPRREESSQKLLYAIADSYCEANNIDLTRESDAGRGPVDFKFSNGYTSRVLIEVKLNKNNPKKGYEKQLAVYQKAENAVNAVFLVLIVTENTRDVEELERLVLGLKKEKQVCPELVVIDGRIQPSASNV